METEQDDYNGEEEYYNMSAGDEESYYDTMSYVTDGFVTAPGSELAQEKLDLNSFNPRSAEYLTQQPTEAPSVDPGENMTEHGQQNGRSQYLEGATFPQDLPIDQNMDMCPIDGNFGIYSYQSANNSIMEMNIAHASGSNESCAPSAVAYNNEDRRSFSPWQSGNKYEIVAPSVNLEVCGTVQGGDQQVDIDLAEWTYVLGECASECDIVGMLHQHSILPTRSQWTKLSNLDSQKGRPENQERGYVESSPNDRMFLDPPPWTPFEMGGAQATQFPQYGAWKPVTSSHRGSSSIPSISLGSSFSNWVSNAASETSHDLLPTDMTDSVATLRPLTADNSTWMSQGSSERQRNTLSPSSCSKPTREVTKPATGAQRRRSKRTARSSSSGEGLLGSNNPDNASRVSSPTPSTASGFPLSDPGVLPCLEDGCFKTFTGTYRQGTLQRHMRLKHGQEEREYACEAGCGRVFLRQDARLNHHRNRHPELDCPAAIPRPDNRRL